MDLYIKIKNNQINNSKKSIICVQKELRQIVDISNKILDKKIIFFQSKIDKLVFINIDLQWLSAVIFNLINNSLKAIKEDGNIYITVDEEDDKCIISVKDNGTGMTAEMLEKVTNESYSKSSAGIGLYIVNEIVKALNGEICIESNFQQGTEVVLKIPTSKNYDTNNVKFENNTMVNDMYYNNMSDLHAFLKG